MKISIKLAETDVCSFDGARPSVEASQFLFVSSKSFFHHPSIASITRCAINERYAIPSNLSS